MGAVASQFTRHVRRFNVIGRTEKILNKDKPIPAPLHKVDAERLKHLLDSKFIGLYVFLTYYTMF